MQVSQSTTLGGFAASLAVNGLTGDFTHTDQSDVNPSWTVDFGQMFNLQGFEILNRGDGCCPHRLQDITITVRDQSDAVVFTSALLNPGNALGGPPRLQGVFPLDLAGRKVTITRTANPGEEGVLSLGEVRIFGYDPPVTIPAYGCGTNLTHVSFPTRRVTQSTEYGGYPAVNAVNGNYYDGGDFTHTQGGGDPNPYWAVDFGALVNLERLTIFNRYQCCPERLSDVTIRVLDGDGDVVWTSPVLNPGNVLGGPAKLDVTIPLGLSARIVVISLPPNGVLSMAEVDIFGSTIVPPPVPALAAGSNLTHVGFPTLCVRQSIDWTAYPAGNALNGDYFGDFTHTLGGDPNPSWTVDFNALVHLERITMFNRSGCCPERLSDVTVTLMDGDGVVVWTSPLLNPGNALGGPATLTCILPLGAARIVTISLPPGGTLSLAEVDIHGSTIAPPAVPPLAAGSNLTHVPFPGRSVTQSSEWPGFPAGNAVNGNYFGDFTHTSGADNNSNWSVDFGTSVNLESFTLNNRPDCCWQRLRDITVRVFNDAGVEVYNSGLLNPENDDPGNPGNPFNPAALSGIFPLDLQGRVVLVSRTPDPDESGGEGPNVLSLGEVDIFGSTSTDFYQTWIADYYTGSDAQTTADPEHDGVRNLVEYAFQLDPTSSALGTISYTGNVLTGLGLPTISSPNEWPLRAIFGRRIDYVQAGLTYTVEFSANLVDWDASLEDPTFIATDGEAMDVVSVPFPADPPEGPLDILYFRVRITK